MKKTVWFAILGILMVVALSGCLNYTIEVHHHLDGTGRYRFEQIVTEDLLSWAAQWSDEEITMEEWREVVLEGEQPLDDLYSPDDPNIRAVSINEDYVNPDTNEWHHVVEVEVHDILIPMEEEAFLLIEENLDGTYSFSFDLDSSPATDEYVEDMKDWFGELRPSLEKSTFRLKLYVNDFIEGDARAVYDPVEKAVTWEIPMDEIAFNPQDYQIWAVYRLEAPEVVEEVQPEVEVPEPDRPEVPLPPPAVVQSEQDAGFLGLPNWVLFAVAGLCCLSLVAVVVVIVVVVVLKKRKKPAQPPSLY